MLFRSDGPGNVLHDCAAAGCETSWDGYNLADGTPAEGRTDPGPEWRRVDQRTVQLAAPAQ